MEMGHVLIYQPKANYCNLGHDFVSSATFHFLRIRLSGCHWTAQKGNHEQISAWEMPFISFDQKYSCRHKLLHLWYILKSSNLKHSRNKYINICKRKKIVVYGVFLIFRVERKPQYHNFAFILFTMFKLLS